MASYDITDLADRALAVGVTAAELVDRFGRRGNLRIEASGALIACNRVAEGDVTEFVQAAEARALRGQRTGSTALATPRQVDYILTLLTRRARSGEGGGFFTGPTTREGIARLTKTQASTYIASLTGTY